MDYLNDSVKSTCLRKNRSRWVVYKLPEEIYYPNNDGRTSINCPMDKHCSGNSNNTTFDTPMDESDYSIRGLFRFKKRELFIHSPAVTLTWIFCVHPIRWQVNGAIKQHILKVLHSMESLFKLQRSSMWRKKTRSCNIICVLSGNNKHILSLVVWSVVAVFNRSLQQVLAPNNSSAEIYVCRQLYFAIVTVSWLCTITYLTHPSNIKVTRDKKSPILSQIWRFSGL